jgi:hypothetical protein
MSEEEASAAPAAVEPEAAPADAGPLTAADIAGWLATSSANARMTSVGKRLGVTAYDQDVIRDFFQWNLRFIQDSGMPAEKVCPLVPHLPLFFPTCMYAPQGIPQGMLVERLGVGDGAVCRPIRPT